MTLEEMKAITEGLIFASGDEGLNVQQLAVVLEVEQTTAREVLKSLINDLEQDSRGIMLFEEAQTYKFTTKKEHATYIQRLMSTPSSTSLSQASLETLAIIAYRQPITRTEIEEVRGVKTERPIQTLTAKALIKEVGRAEGSGRAILYGTTKQFLEYFGLKSIEELPPLPEEMKEDSFEDETNLFFEKFQKTIEE
ncbi:SMC-Scp complex subunit ScpB [Bacillus solimangrovi]|uniref:Segregation and condensation protein B n=1 Tax=Bacillus solimangrovi TaxID=1305675 RepID=A0A1E5LHK6_9BACI|nr:SMC-Scp complex subunit ScpB [Bacillus solimangrovi]OEH93536.1 SMC-Scp complex subunit ScpB [Bacillus solimangrovi]